VARWSIASYNLGDGSLNKQGHTINQLGAEIEILTKSSSLNSVLLKALISLV